MRGYWRWETCPVFALPKGGVYFGGRIFDVWLEAEEGPLRWADDDGAAVLETMAKTHIVQRPYRGDAAPLRADRKAFSVQFLGDGEEDYLVWEEALAIAEPQYFCPGVYAFDAFRASAGQTYTLTRPLAEGIVPGVARTGGDPLDFPVIVRLNQTDAPEAATVSGQTVTANASGVLTIGYLAAFRVVMQSVSRGIASPNKLQISAEFVEKVSGLG